MNTVGEILRRERELQGLEIKDIENATNIRALYLNAIEEGNYKVTPGEVYLKGFIRNYASHLGLDPKEIMEVYRQEKEMFQGDYKEPDEQPSSKNSQKLTFKERRNNRRREDREKPGSSLVKGLIIIILVIGGIGAACWALFSLNMPPNPDSSSSPSNIEQGNNPSLSEVALNNTNSPNAAPPPEPAAQITSPQVQANTPATDKKNVMVTAVFKDKCWTQVNIDGRLEYEGTPKRGETLTFNGDQRIFMKFGSAGAVDLTHNGKPLGNIGAIGEVVIKTFTKDTINTVNLR